MQAGREVRVMVRPDAVDDLGAELTHPATGVAG